MHKFIYSKLLGLTFSKVEIENNKNIIFTLPSGQRMSLPHWQPSLEGWVEVKKIQGNLESLEDASILSAEEIVTIDYLNGTISAKYIFSTIKGEVTIFWPTELNPIALKPSWELVSCDPNADLN